MTDKEIIVGYTVDMAKAQGADEIMKHWADDVNWFDITARHLKGYDSVYKEFSAQFGKLKECGAEILEIDCKISGNLGIVTSKQDFWAISKSGHKDTMITRQTDCYEKIDNEWKLIHQHISLCLEDALKLVG